MTTHLSTPIRMAKMSHNTNQKDPVLRHQSPIPDVTAG